MVLAAWPGYIVCMDDEGRQGVWVALAALFQAVTLSGTDLGCCSFFKHKTGFQRILGLRWQLFIQ